jgi:glycerol dehydrogenase-like iron-containing ADH family enzyme
MAETDRLRVLGTVRRIDALIVATLDAEEAKVVAAALAAEENEVIIGGGLSLDAARAVATWAQVRRGLIDSHPGLMSVQGVAEVGATMTDDELAAAIYEELTG